MKCASETYPAVLRLALKVKPGLGPGFSDASAGKEFGGWGLVIVEELSDRWGVLANHPHSVWFEIDR